MDHPLFGLFAYQEALLIESVFGIALLVMLWTGFRRWIRHKERVAELIAAQHGAQMQSVEARLNAIEQQVGGGTGEAARQIEAPATDVPPERVTRRDEA